MLQIYWHILIRVKRNTLYHPQPSKPPKSRPIQNIATHYKVFCFHLYTCSLKFFFVDYRLSYMLLDI